jgi:hypothetical protein
MRSIVIMGFCGLIAFGGASGVAEAKGCLKGAAVGGAAGHVAGHHGVLGATAGCAVGHHEASKQERARQAQNGNGDTGNETH